MPIGLLNVVLQTPVKEYLLLAFFLLAVVLLYVGLSPRVATLIYRPILFHPVGMEENFPAPVVNHIQAEDVYLTQADGGKVHGWFFQLPGAHHTILISHGNGGNISLKLPLIEALLKMGASVLVFDYSGYGKSTGLPDLKYICANASSAYDYLTKEKNIKPEQIVLYGESLGGAVSAELASRCNVSGIIIQSGFTALPVIAREKFPALMIYPDWLFPQPILNTGNTLSKRKLPLLILHGTDDQVVPYNHAEELFRCAAEPKKLVKFQDTGHSDFLIQQPDLFCAELKKFLAELKN